MKINTSIIKTSFFCIENKDRTISTINAYENIFLHINNKNSILLFLLPHKKIYFYE